MLDTGFGWPPSVIVTAVQTRGRKGGEAGEEGEKQVSGSTYYCTVLPEFKVKRCTYRPKQA